MSNCIADHQHYRRLIDAMAAAGMTPAVDHMANRQWVADRWDGVAVVGETLLLARRDVDEQAVRWQITTRHGVIFDEGMFSITELGLAMFTAAMLAGRLV